MPSVAIVGASSNRKKYGNMAVRAYAENGFDVYPVNPQETEIEGNPCFAGLGDIPVALDRVSIYLPPEKALAILDDLAELNVGEVWLNPGVDTVEVVDKAHNAGLNVICGCSILDLGLSPADYA